MATSYAIVETGGKQYRAEKGGSLVVEHLPADEGAKVSLRPVLYRGDKQVVVDDKDLEKVKVEAVVAEHLRGPKIRIFKYKAKKGYRRRAGHRQSLTRLEVTEVRMLTRKPAAKAEAKAEEPKAKTEAVAEQPEPSGGSATKEPAAKPAPKKAAPKAKAKPAAKKPAAKKPPAKKPAAAKPAPKRKAQSSGKSSPKTPGSSSAKK
jgi:large subunit ribosomal protein L21